MAKQEVIDYWQQQWPKAVATQELEDHSQSIPNDFLQVITSPREVLTVIKNAKTIIDFGSGTGHLCHVLSLLGWNTVSGIEISEYIVDYANKKYGNGRVSFKLEESINDCDLIVTSNTLEHFHDPYKLIEDFLIHCKHLIILVPYKGGRLSDTPSGGAGHVYRFDIKEFNDYDVLELFVFRTRGWTEGENPLQLCVLLKGKL